jgi:hypothetical protein
MDEVSFMKEPGGVNCDFDIDEIHALKSKLKKELGVEHYIFTEEGRGGNYLLFSLTLKFRVKIRKNACIPSKSAVEKSRIKLVAHEE